MAQRYKSSGEFDYEFEELFLADDDNLYNGSASVSYTYDAPDASVGDYGSFDWSIDGVTLEIGGYPVVIDPTQRELHDHIAKALTKAKGDFILNAVKAHAEN